MEVVFTFQSTHDALRGEYTLLKGNIAVKVMALPSGLGAGCGLCLRVAPDALSFSRTLLDEAGINLAGVYFKYTGNGKTTYSIAIE